MKMSKSKTIPYKNPLTIVREIIIDGIKVPYDVASTASSVKKAIAGYPETEFVRFEYIGSGNICFVDGRKNVFKNKLHCFKSIQKGN